MAREVDPKKKLPFAQKNDTYGIYGYCDFDGIKMQANSKTSSSQIKRLILRTDNDKANDLSVNLRRSLLKRCQNLRIRTDIVAEGLYFVQTWLL